MAGLTRRVRTVYQLAVAAVVFAGCEPVTYTPPVAFSESSGAAGLHSSDGVPGRVVGRVTWAGELPVFPPLLAVRGMGGTSGTHEVPSPFAPRIDANTKGLSGAVVFLRGVSPERSGPWCHPIVTVEIRGDDLTVNGGGVGFVPVGGEVTFVSREEFPQLIRGRNAGYFALALPEPDASRRWRFEKPGRFELSSGAGQHWMQADLFVCEHPYYTTTDERGLFRFDGVPPGRYELVAWHRNGRVVRQERDPDTGLVARLTFDTPYESTQIVKVESGRSADVAVSLGQPATK